MAAKLS